MNLYIDYKPDYSGKGKFLLRLIDALGDRGVKLSSEKSADVELGIVYWKHMLNVPRVLRIDGVHIMESPKLESSNKNIRSSIKHSDAVIFQSQFSKRIATTVLGIEPKRSFVIYNGDTKDRFNVTQIESPYPNNVIMVAHWGKDRPAKRLVPMLRIARKYTREHNDVRFWVIGTVINRVRSKYASDQIVFTGEIEDPLLRRYQVRADVMLNLAWVDWCPNAVVESLCAGTPVICSNGSGVAEIVRDCGTVLDLDEFVDGKTVFPRDAPEIDEDKVFAALDYELKAKRRVHADWLQIETIARQYKNVFESIM
jgi:glycosyltransferase involved in cell wall biosynthesis